MLMSHSPANTGRKGEHLHDSMANFLEQCLQAHMVGVLELERLELSAETLRSKS